jgi:hypothetical protein
MVYHGTGIVEEIYMGPDGNLEDVCCVELIKVPDEPVFYVTTCCNTDWIWKFNMDGESNYEMIKHTIIDAIFECNDIIELMDCLDAVFEEDFDDIVVWEEVYDDCCCENCNHRGCLN